MSSQAPSPPVHDSPDDLAVLLLSRTAWALRRLTEEALEPHGLGSRHFALLAALACRSPLTQQALGALLGIDRTTIVHLLDELEERSAVTRRVHPEDRRAHAIELTASGRTLLQIASREVRAVEERFLAPLSPAERERLHQLLTRILAPIQAAKGCSAP